MNGPSIESSIVRQTLIDAERPPFVITRVSSSDAAAFNINTFICAADFFMFGDADEFDGKSDLGGDCVLADFFLEVVCIFIDNCLEEY